MVVSPKPKSSPRSSSSRRADGSSRLGVALRPISILLSSPSDVLGACSSGSKPRSSPRSSSSSCRVGPLFRRVGVWLSGSNWLVPKSKVVVSPRTALVGSCRRRSGSGSGARRSSSVMVSGRVSAPAAAVCVWLLGRSTLPGRKAYKHC